MQQILKITSTYRIKLENQKEIHSTSFVTVASETKTQKPLKKMIDIHQLCADLDRAMKRHRGQPLPIDTKLKIVSELMQQRQQRAPNCKRQLANDERRQIRPASLGVTR